jgi:hypothetical protein
MSGLSDMGIRAKARTAFPSSTSRQASKPTQTRINPAFRAIKRFSSTRYTEQVALNQACCHMAPVIGHSAAKRRNLLSLFLSLPLPKIQT